MDHSTQVNMCLFATILFASVTSCSCNWANSSYEQCETLMEFKEGVDDPHNTLSSWINGSNCCDGWKGVGCDVTTQEVVTLNISFGQLNGTVNEVLFQLKSLVHLDLSNNTFSGGIPKTIDFTGLIPPHLANLSRLHFLDLSSLVGWDSDNALNYYYLKSEDLAWLKNLRELQYLSLSGVELNGMAGQQWGENIGHLYNLQTLDLSHCNISGTIPSLEGSISLSSFQNLTKLTEFTLSGNQLTVHIPPKWTLPFQLKFLGLSGCNIGGAIPPFISTQYTLTSLYLANNSLIGSIPAWLWDLPLLDTLDLSQNNLTGQLALPNSPSNVHTMLFNTNDLTCSIPLEIGTFFPNLTVLLFASNNFSGIIPSSIGNMKYLNALDLSYNKLHGKIPSSLGNCLDMVALRLTKNNLEGEIPMEIGNLPWLETLHLNGNQLIGTLFSHGLQNSRALKIFDAGNNRISGHIPRWLGNLSQLSILVLRANYLEGPIPHNLAKLTAMTHISQPMRFRLQNLSITDGSIPSAIQELNGLITLNLSRNHLSGDIPDVFGIDMQLESLDLSHNQLSGKVPVSLQFPGSLGVLNLSYNRLCGRIPLARHLDTFGEDSYVGNPCLCGPPLNTSCWHGVAPPTTEDDEEEDESENELWWYGGLLLSHVVGFWVMLAVLFLKRERRRKCLRVMERVAVRLLGRIGYW
eukprot:Gb_35271 [translate_table: standard]